jgi:hypothetical protein
MNPQLLRIEVLLPISFLLEYPVYNLCLFLLIRLPTRFIKYSKSALDIRRKFLKIPLHLHKKIFKNV